MQRKNRANNSLSIQGLIYQPVPGDGHCLFNAVALYIGQDQQNLRKIVAAHLEDHLTEFKNFIDLPEGKTLESYIQDVRNGEEWASHIEIEILMRVLKRPIVVIELNRNVIFKNNESNDGEPIFVYYNGHNHYDAFLLEEGYDDSQQILQRLLQLNRSSISENSTSLEEEINHTQEVCIDTDSCQAANYLDTNSDNRIRHDLDEEEGKDLKTKVTILVWQKTSSLLTNDGFTSGLSFGHAALKTYTGNEKDTGYYISFWPGGCSSEFCKNNKAHLHDKDTDDLIEQFAPIQIDLRKLDIEAINKEFLKFKDSNYNWCTLGSSFIRIKGATNCSGLVSDLLIVGGINKQVRMQDEIFYSSIVGSIFGVIKFYVLYLLVIKHKFSLSRKELFLKVTYAALLSALQTVCARILSTKLGLDRDVSVNSSLTFSNITNKMIGPILATFFLKDINFLPIMLKINLKSIWEEKEIPSTLAAFLLHYFANRIRGDEYSFKSSFSYAMSVESNSSMLVKLGFLFTASIILGEVKLFILPLTLLIRHLWLLSATAIVPKIFSFSIIATTPSHVKELAESAANAEKKNNLKVTDKNFMNSTYEKVKNHKKLVGAGIAGAALATVGFFAIKNNHYANTICADFLKNTENLIKSFSNKGE